MKEELYRQALSSFNNGDYERALDILTQGESQLFSIQEKQLLEQCKKQITEQYYYFINDSIRQEDYFTARALKEKHKVKYGANPRIDNIAIPQKKIETPSLPSSEPDEGDGSAKSTRLWAIIGGIVIIGMIGFLYWQYNSAASNYNQENDSSPRSEQLSKEYITETVIDRLTQQFGSQIKILYKYPELSDFCVFSIQQDGTNYLYVYDVGREQMKMFDVNKLRTTNAGELSLHSYTLSMNESNDKIQIQGNNGVNGIGHTEYVLELDPVNWEIKGICFGSTITKQENGYKVNRTIKAVPIDIYYDFNGNPIPSPLKGERYLFKGKIDNKYAVTMQISIWNGKIYGEYYYDRYGSKNVLRLYGGISSGRDIILLELNDKGEQTGTFRGGIGMDYFSGTFVNNQGKEMPFELYPVVDPSSDSNKGQSSANASINAYIPDRDAEFPGGMVGLGQYITDNLQYPADAKAKGISGNVRVSYIIDKDGSITDVKVIESVDPDLDREAVRLISSMPKWKPGIRQSKFVKMRTSTEIRFELE